MIFPQTKGDKSALRALNPFLETKKAQPTVFPVV